MPSHIIGIGGVTCGGKTTVTSKLKEKYPSAHVMSLDDYYWDEGSPEHKYLPEFDYENWDIPSSLDYEKLLNDVNSWKEKHSSAKDGNQVLLIEGFLIYASSALLDHFNLKIFITLNRDQCWERRKARDYLPPEPAGYFQAVAWPCYEDHLQSMSETPDIIYMDGSKDIEEVYQKTESLIEKLLAN